MDIDEIEIPSSTEIKGWYDFLFQLLHHFISAKTKEKKYRYKIVSRIYTGIQHIHVEYLRMFVSFHESMPSSLPGNTNYYRGYIGGTDVYDLTHNQVTEAVKIVKQRFAEERQKHSFNRQVLRCRATAHLRAAHDEHERLFVYMVICYLVYQFNQHMSYMKVYDQPHKNFSAKLVAKEDSSTSMRSPSTYFLDKIQQTNDPNELRAFAEEAIDDINARYFDIVEAFTLLQRKWDSF